jgi:2-phospho-L-lactate guanylyltransferase
MPRSDLSEHGASITPRAADATPWCLVVPVKRLGLAKTRLAGPDMPPALRERLALAFAADAVGAALSASRVAGAVVVTDDPRAAEVLGAIGATIVPDKPDAGLNAAFLFGATAARREFGTEMGIAACTADLPALRATELDIALAQISSAAQISGSTRHFIADAHDIGTTMLFAPPGTELNPRFGGPSRAAHAASGALELPPAGISSLRRDVDTAADLADALQLGVGPHTTEIWSARDRVASGV